jgi:hypothetical protein
MVVKKLPSFPLIALDFGVLNNDFISEAKKLGLLPFITISSTFDRKTYNVFSLLISQNQLTAKFITLLIRETIFKALVMDRNCFVFPNRFKMVNFRSKRKKKKKRKFTVLKQKKMI